MANVETVKLPYNKIGFVKNPLLVPTEIPVKNNWATVSTGKILADVSTGEIERTTTVATRKVIDSEKFSKLYTDGVSLAFELSKPAQAVFKTVLSIQGKDEDFIYLSFMAIQARGGFEMSERTFKRGMDELIDKRFLAHGNEPNKFWTNAHLFHNGDRVRFLTEYIKSNRTERIKKAQDKALTEHEELEEIGQQRLVD